MLTPTRMRTSPDRPRSQRRLHLERGAHGPLGVVLVGDRGAEQGDDRVADDLVDLAAEGVDVGRQPREAAVDEVLDVLGVAPLGQRGEADEVGEQHGDDPAFVGVAVGARVQRVCAGGAEAGPVRRLCSA